MDLVDVKILKLLWEDGRMPIYRIASELGFSSAAIHKRIRAMMERGELRGFTILLNSDKILNSAVISIRARKKREEVMEIISGVSGVMHVVAAFGGRYYGEFWYGDEFELADKVNFLEKLTEAYRVEVYRHNKREDVKLSKLDWRIILGMKEDARKPFSQLSKEIGVSSKTIAKRWSKLREMDVCKAYPIINRPSARDIFWFSLFIEVDNMGVEEKIASIKNLWRISTFMAPRMVYGVFYGNSIKEVDEIMEEVIGIKGVKKVLYEIFVDEIFLPDYLDYVAYKKGYRGD